MRDFRRLQQDPPQGVNGSPTADNILRWKAVIFGPEDTPWDGGEKGEGREREREREIRRGKGGENGEEAAVKRSSTSSSPLDVPRRWFLSLSGPRLFALCFASLSLSLFRSRRVRLEEKRRKRKIRKSGVERSKKKKAKDSFSHPRNKKKKKTPPQLPSTPNSNKGTFKLTLEFTEEYPIRPPLVKFVSRMYHPNIYADGGICLDILQKAWSPIYDVAAVLTSVQSLLSDPNPDSPANAEAARLYGEDRREYNRRVKEVVERSWIEGGGEEGEEAGEEGGGGEGGAAAATTTTAATTATATTTAAEGGGEGANDATAATADDASQPAGSAGAAPAQEKEEEAEEEGRKEEEKEAGGERAKRKRDDGDGGGEDAAPLAPPPPRASS